MKQLLSILTFLFVAHYSHSQDMNDSSKELGLDISAPLIYMSGGIRDLEIDIIYRIVDPKKDIRYKLSFSGQNYLGRDFADVQLIEYSSSTDFEYFDASYHPKISVIGSFGIAKYLKRSQVPIYAGLDTNIGIAPGVVESVIRKMEQGRESVDYLFTNQKNNLLILGFTPVLGVKKQLTDKFGFGFEFGLNMNTVQGKLSYKNQNEEDVSIPVFHLHRGAFKIINDISVFLKI